MTRKRIIYLPIKREHRQWLKQQHTSCSAPISWRKQCSPRIRGVFSVLPEVLKDPPLCISGTHHSIRCSHCMEFQAWRTCQEHHKELCSIQRNWCKDCPLQALYSTTHRTWFLDHLVQEYIDMTPNHRPGKLNQYIPIWEKYLISDTWGSSQVIL